MRLAHRILATLVVTSTLPLAGAGVATTATGLPVSSLAVRADDGASYTFWRSESAPARWLPDPRVLLSIQWRPGQAGMMWAEMGLEGSGEAWRTRVVLVRMEPAKVALSLANGASPGGYDATWNLDAAPPEAVMAVNAGQFSGGAVWGWVVHEGKQYRPPGQGPLATAVIVDSAGAVRFTTDYTTPAVEAFQSFPVLLAAGNVPELLRTAGPYLSLSHRDARLALCQLYDGSLLLALTRFDGLGESFGRIPFGLTVPEMAALMGALGCRDAVALDGGVSAQLLVRDLAGQTHTWRGMRRVPLALLALPR